jgi:DNA invertase Pin-like site-specific DNA recombinase
MRRSFSLNKPLLESFRRSPVLRRLAEQMGSLAAEIKAEHGKIIPVSKVARILNVSVRLLWKWIDQGWISTYKRPSQSYKKGISKQGFTRFLKRLTEYKGYAYGMCSPLKRGRPPVAVLQVKNAYHSNLLQDGMTPDQCAKALGISRDSVLRAFKNGYVRSFKISRCRLCLGDRRKAKLRKNDLTAFLQKAPQTF